jgi:putative glutamine amidotransferase
VSARATVGITVSTGTVQAGAWTEHMAYSPYPYVRAVHAAGARALLLVPDEDDAANPGPLLERLDAVILSGGAGDVDPARYGAKPHPATNPDVEVRDAYEIALARRAPELGVPLLGICRGMQLMCVAYGGTLEQHLPDALGHDRHRRMPSGFSEHGVRLEPGSLAERAAGEPVTTVRSHHHQGVRDPGERLVVTGRSDDEDAIVEAVELTGNGFVLGVLWHPEEDETSRVIRTLVDACPPST